MKQYRNGAVQIANLIAHTLNERDGWCTRYLSVTDDGAVFVVMENYDAGSGEPYGEVSFHVTHVLYSEQEEPSE